MNERARELIQEALPAYEVAGELGRGAFGVVYEARHTQLGRSVAIKQLPQSFAENDDVRERFVAEAQMVASLEHPHVVPVYDFVESAGSRFLIMERCAGSVGDRFKNEGLVTDEACAAVLACLAALDFAHEKGLLHRDVKPENLMYDMKGVIKLGDFGIARDLGVETRRTATGMIVGTPAYMSPEQCRGDDLTPASDVYSVAMMGYELLTGALPFPSTTSVNGLLAHHLVTVPTPLLQTRPELPGAVGEVIDKALAKDLNVRYSTAVEFATALARACVTAFGSGWLRRRRFILHWPEIIAETERPDSNSPRTGTIMVRAGDLPHAVVVPKDQVEPLPVAVIGNADAPTLPPEDAQVSAPTADAAAAYPPALPTPAPQHGTPSSSPPPDPTVEEISGPNWALFSSIAAVLAAIIIGIVVFAGGGSNETGLTVTQNPVATVPPVADVPNDAPTAKPVTNEPTAEPQQDEATAVPAATTAPVAQPTSIGEPTVGPDAEQPFVMGSNGNPIMNRLPLDFDDSLVDSPWAPNPCPIEQELVACIFAVVDATAPEDDNLSVPWFTLGYTPQIEPIDYHLHFYIPELVGGDETKAGTATPGGAWRIWDGPWPATSFGGDGGRTLYTMADFRAAGSTTLCVIVANPEHEAIPGSGNCAPVVSDADSDNDEYFVMLDRIEGQWVGSCRTRAMAIAPPEWRWYDLNDMSPGELAAEIRPTAIAQTAALLEEFETQGGVIWAEGPVEGDFIVNFSMTLIPGNFTLNDDPQRVAEVLGQLGIPTGNGGQRQIGDGPVYFEVNDVGSGRSGATYLIPDSGYAISFTLTAPDGLGYDELGDQIAYTIQGC
ncbi:serine/threonine protein kinase [bacterium]|nr:serine/threonine protein kinase [bacterium]